MQEELFALNRNLEICISLLAVSINGKGINNVLKDVYSSNRKACREIGLAYLYNYIVVNDTVENAADKIMAIIRSEHARTIRSISGYKKLLEEANNEH